MGQKPSRWSGWFPGCLLGVGLGFGCSAPGGPESVGPRAVDAGTEAPQVTQSLTCKPAQASEDLGPRIDLMGGAALATGRRVIHTSDLFERFNTNCGMCHVSTTNGGKHTSKATFAMDFDTTWLAAMKNPDPNKVMPPVGVVLSSRPENDPIRQLVALLEPWLEQGRPTDVFAVDGAAAGPTAAGSGYTYTAMTNLGNCIPGLGMYASSASTEMESKDELFANATSLPSNLTDTDLTTFDSEVLAAHGVLAFVPTYPLWSDGSGKLRHIRVPKGTTINFSKEKQTFEIPRNTRFYKTFFRKVIDGAGRESNRKMETRLIVSRPDGVDTDGSTPLPTALYGTYEWSEDEMTATLRDDPYRDGTGFADKTAEYISDELEYRDLIEAIPNGGNFASLRHEALKKHPDLLRHYAIPGAIRCVQCHRGSPVKSFVLGFTPLQLARRANGTGGTYEPTGADELTQLQRFIDIGLISGMTSPADVLPLERTQTPRTSRTDEELKAQAYMVGNCAHCHNPRGYPSLAKPELASALNFLPGSDGGIFEFPLDRMSPVRSRGANGDVPIPYITPSLRDYPVANLDDFRMDTGALLSAPIPDTPTEKTWTPKYLTDLEFKFTTKDFDAGCASVRSDVKAYCGKRTSGHTFVAAPWRSLIYRNVDAPFPYFDDYVPFPHMPMNSAGFDCRAPQIMGDWMVTLPAARKRPRISEDALPTRASTQGDGSYDDSPQPYVEVKSGETGYAAALVAAHLRRTEYHEGVRYNYCQDVLGADILDPVGHAGFTATDARPVYLPDTDRYTFGGNWVSDPTHPGELVQPVMGVPYHSHWFDYDPTDSPPPWQPRRANVWKTVLVDRMPDRSLPAGVYPLAEEWQEGKPAFTAEMASRKKVVDAINQATLTEELRKYAITELPYGLWQTKPECHDKLARQKTVSAIMADTANTPPVWMVNAPLPARDAPVYMMSPGAALYRHICFNCHGPRADGRGLQGDALAASSEGQARPANFMVGLFGPLDSPGQNLLNVFGGPSRDMKTAITWASRYMPWMALGGTLALIPTDVIHQVEATKILGQTRQHVELIPDSSGASANMLNLAKGLCSLVLPDPTNPDPRLIKRSQFREGRFDGGYPFLNNEDAPFVKANGDWEMWMNLCSRYSPPVVRVYSMKADGERANQWVGYVKALYYADGSTSNDASTRGTKLTYPSNAQVLDHNGTVQVGVAPPGSVAENYYPACIQNPNDLMPGEVQPNNTPEAEWQKFRTAYKLPDCPAVFLQAGGEMWRDMTTDTAELDNVKQWALRGAIAAGMSVFSYLQTADLGHKSPKPYFSECQLLP